jgi:hypothetical protein
MLEHCYWDLLSFSHNSISEVEHWCWTFRPGLQLAFQIILKVFHGVEVRALCRPVKFFHTDLRQTISLWTLLCAQGHCHTETAKGLPQTFAIMLEAQNHLECHCMLKALARTMKTSADHYSSSTELDWGTLQIIVCVCYRDEVVIQKSC